MDSARLRRKMRLPLTERRGSASGRRNPKRRAVGCATRFAASIVQLAPSHSTGNLTKPTSETTKSTGWPLLLLDEAKLPNEEKKGGKIF